jgi:hypothetical protein
MICILASQRLDEEVTILDEYLPPLPRLAAAMIDCKGECAHLSCDVFPSSLLVVHDSSGCCQDDVSERTGRQQDVDPVLNLRELYVEARGDDTAFVDSSVELDDNLA